jgi:hypothetical protein
MFNTRRLRAVLIGVVTVVAIAPAVTANAAADDTATAGAATTNTTTSHVRDVCGPTAPGVARCLAQERTDVHGGYGLRAATALPAGYGPTDLHSAYNLPMTGGETQTVATVDANDDPTAEADLAVYRSTYGLPPCTTDNGCFHKVNQEGATSPLPEAGGWGLEISLDLDMISAACPHCHIVLVEADDAGMDSLAAAENTAVGLGADEVSNSYALPEVNGMSAFEAAYTHPGVAIVASTGDFGYGIPNMPAVFPSVIAAGGTSLTRADNARGWTESAWSGSASGCSAWVDKPSWQQDPNCPGRMIADVAAVADPNTGVAIYDSYNSDGWRTAGGTSASSPFLAGVIALAGNPGRYQDASYFYSHANELNDVASGTNKHTDLNCGGDYQCNAVPGYDGPTGNGTPNGLTAF